MRLKGKFATVVLCLMVLTVFSCLIFLQNLTYNNGMLKSEISVNADVQYENIAEVVGKNKYNGDKFNKRINALKGLSDSFSWYNQIKVVNEEKPSGNGKFATPYQITSAAELLWVSQRVNYGINGGNSNINIEIKNDIDLSKYTTKSRIAAYPVQNKAYFDGDNRAETQSDVTVSTGLIDVEVGDVIDVNVNKYMKDNNDYPRYYLRYIPYDENGDDLLDIATHEVQLRYNIGSEFNSSYKIENSSIKKIRVMVYNTGTGAVSLTPEDLYVSIYKESNTEITYNAYDWLPIGFTKIFSGTINGNGKTISNLTNYARKYSGLFGNVETINAENLNFENCCIETLDSTSDTGGYIGIFAGKIASTLSVLRNIRVGSAEDSEFSSVSAVATAEAACVAGYARFATIENVVNYGYIEVKNSSHSGGVFGYFSGTNKYEKATANNITNYGKYKKTGSSGLQGGVTATSQNIIMDNIVNYGDVEATAYQIQIGGVACNLDFSNATNCINYGNVTFHSGEKIGGVFAGVNQMTTISNCYFRGELTSTSNDLSQMIGGIAGWSSQNATRQTYINNCANYGKITINNGKSIGGIFGYDGNRMLNTVSDCANYGNITVGGEQRWIGGIGGVTNDAIILRCINKGNITGPSDVGGILGGYSWTTKGADSDKYETGCYSCYNSGTITSTITDVAETALNTFVGNAGGILGAYEVRTSGARLDPIFRDCVNEGSISGRVAGGLVGYINAYGAFYEKEFDGFKDCYNIGIIQGGNFAGGIAGGIVINDFDPVVTIKFKNVYSTSNVSAGEISGLNNKGSIIGRIYDTTTNSSAVTTTLSFENVYSIRNDGDPLRRIGHNGGINNGTSTPNSNNVVKTTDNGGSSNDLIKTGISADSFINFDFQSVWGFAQDYNNGLPYVKSVDEAEIVFNYNLGDLEEPTIIRQRSRGGSYAISAIDYDDNRKYGYQVDYWTLNADGSGEKYGVGYNDLNIDILKRIQLYAVYKGREYKIKIKSPETEMLSGSLLKVDDNQELDKEPVTGGKLYSLGINIENSDKYKLSATGTSTDLESTSYNFIGWYIENANGDKVPVIYNDLRSELPLNEVYTRIVEGWVGDGDIITLTPQTGNKIFITFELDGDSRGTVKVNGVNVNYEEDVAVYSGVEYQISAVCNNYYVIDSFTVNYPIVGTEQEASAIYNANFTFSADSKYEGKKIVINVKFKAQDIDYRFVAIDMGNEIISSINITNGEGVLNIGGTLENDVIAWDSDRYVFSHFVIYNQRDGSDYANDGENILNSEGEILSGRKLLKKEFEVFDQYFLYNYQAAGVITIYAVYETWDYLKLDLSDNCDFKLYVDSSNSGLSEMFYENQALLIKNGSRIRVEALPKKAYNFSNFLVVGTDFYTVVENQITFVLNSDVTVGAEFSLKDYKIKYLTVNENGSIIGEVGGGICVNGTYGNIVHLNDVILFELPEASKYKLLSIFIKTANGSEEEVTPEEIARMVVDNEFLATYFDSDDIFTITAQYRRQRTFVLTMDSGSENMGTVECYKVTDGDEERLEIAIGETYIFDARTVIKIIANPKKFYSFYQYKGNITASEKTDKNNIVNINLTSDRVILVTFKEIEYKIDIVDRSETEKAKGDFGSGTTKVKVGDRVTLTFAPRSGYVVKNWTINGINVVKSNDRSNIVYGQNTVTITITEEWLEEFKDNIIESAVETSISPMILGIVIGGGAGILVLMIILIILIVFNRKQNLKIKEELMEENKNKMKFVATSDIVSKLKSGQNVTNISEKEIKAAKKAKKAAKKEKR